MADDDRRCESTTHDQHLCWMAAQTVRPSDSAHQASLAEQEALTQNPRFRCDWCGRVAARARNLCKPVTLSENDSCQDAGHERHLCHLVAQAVLHHEPLAYYGGWPILQGREDLVRAPRFQCQTCGRPARHAENLCTPMKV
jgi:hypothetical protein